MGYILAIAIIRFNQEFLILYHYVFRLKTHGQNNSNAIY